MPSYGYTVRIYRSEHKAAFIFNHRAEARAAADLLGPAVIETLYFDFASVGSESDMMIQFRTKIGGRAVWIEVVPDGDRLKAEKVLDQRPVISDVV